MTVNRAGGQKCESLKSARVPGPQSSWPRGWPGDVFDEGPDHPIGTAEIIKSACVLIATLSVLRTLQPHESATLQGMPDPTPIICAACGTTHQVHQHTVSVNNHGALPCPACGAELVRWSGDLFYTLAVVNQRSAGDMPIVDDAE